MSRDFKDRVAIVTGAGNGLGKAHAMALAAEGAKVVVNDLSGPAGPVAATQTVNEILAAGGQAILNGANVTDQAAIEEMVDQTMSKWGRIDILVNNAGILRDKSFAKMTAEDFMSVLDVHVMGAFHCTKAVWPHMREAKYGRIVMTSSVSGLYGNFGQANYAAAKMALIGMMNTLHIEGQKYDIRVNTLAPTAYTKMLEGLVDEESAEALSVTSVSPGLLYLTCEAAPSKMILGAGAGGFAVSHIYETTGAYLQPEERTFNHIAASIDQIGHPAPTTKYENAFGQTEKFITLAKG